MKFIKNLFRATYRSIANFINHDGIEHAGYLSFLVLFSIFPFIIFFLTLTTILGFAEFGVKFVEVIIEAIPGEIIQQRAIELLKTPPPSILTLAILGSIWTASSFVEGLRTILNRIYGLSTLPSYIFRRMLSIAQFLLISLFLFGGMMILVVLPIVLSKFSEVAHIFEHLSTFWHYVRYVLIFICLFLSSSALYYIIPNVKISYRSVLPGSFLTVSLWIFSAHLTSNYIKYYSQLNFIYGSIGNIIITLIFFYLVNLIFIYGAEFNHQISNEKY